MPDFTNVQVSLTNMTSVDHMLAMWAELQSRATHSFFLSAGWMRAWLECLPMKDRPAVLVAEQGGRVVGLGLLGRHCQRRRGVIKSNGLHLNETGDEQYDHLTMEHNGFLADPTCEPEVLHAILEFLAGSATDWDELHFSAIDATNPVCNLLSQPPAPLVSRLVKESAVPIVDLQRLRESGAEYLSQLSGNTRSQIRRAMRQHEQIGKLAIDRPESAADALNFFDEMKTLHQAYWQSCGEPGAFGSEFYDRFHRTLITQRWTLGEIQLLRVRAGDHVVGLLYNFLHRGRVLFYQSGIDYGGDRKLKPGLVCQVLAVQDNLQIGADVYDFLFGSSQYKQSLSTASESLRWMVWQRPHWRFRMENWLRQAKRKFRHLSRLA